MLSIGDVQVGRLKISLDRAGEAGARREAMGRQIERESDRAGWLPTHLVGARGFEPPTSSSRTMRATKLRHAPTEGPLRARE